MEKQHELVKEAAVEFVELLINVGIINSISESWPEQVQENWCHRLGDMVKFASNQIREVQEFASAYDGD